PVRKLRGCGAGRVPSVVIVVVLAFSIIGGIGTLLGQQITDLASTQPQYQTTNRDKVRALREAAVSSGLLSRMASFVSNLNQEISRKSDGPQNERPRQDNSQPAPVPVEIHQAPPTPMEVIQRIIQPLLDPLVTTGVVVIFVIFFLLQREDLRDRLIRLAGSHDLQRTTEAIDDGAQRLSRYFLAQLALNMLFGVIVGTGLALIGVPNPLLFGIMAAILRFVPYIGGFLSGTFPVALAIAVDPGWSMALITIGFFLVVEPLIGQVIEPLVYGHSTGLSPVAVILAATFWTWLWGPVGLLLSTPLTVCLSVLGRHIEWLNFLDVLLGDDPPLTPAQAFYQRALAGDIDEML